jgi:hypothetical protein
MRKHRKFGENPIKFGESVLRALGARPIRAHLGRYAAHLGF